MKRTRSTGRKTKFARRKLRTVNRPVYSPRTTSAYSRMPAILASNRGEIKCVDIVTTNSPFQLAATPPVIALLNGVQTGAGFFNRVGSKVEMVNLHIRGFITNVSTAVQDFGRIVIVYDRQPNGAIPIVSDILQTRSQTGAATNTGYSEINLDQRDRFQIIRDYEVHLPSVTNTAGVLTNVSYVSNDERYAVNMFIKLKGMVTHFKSSSNPTTIADINTGALYLFCLDAIGAGAWSFFWQARLRYMDL